MRRILFAVTALSFSFLIAGCFRESSIKRDLDKRGTLDLMKEVANDKYTPPKDGKLTDAQVQMYLKVRNHERDIAKVAAQKMQEKAKEADAQKNTLSGMVKGFQAMSAGAEFATADIRAAKDLHYNTQEYLWVKGQVLAASMAAYTEKVADAMSAQVDAARAQAQKAYDEAKDEQSKAMAKQMLDAYAQTAKEGQQTAQQTDPAVKYNRELLKKYDTELAAFTTEMSKYEQKDGDAQKTMDDFQKSLDKAKQDAQKQQ
jgi:chromosome segregation ATPase